MADNLSQKSHKTSEKNKYNNVVHRTTSESLRLNDTEKGVNHPTSLQAASHNTRKISSFQITSVTVGSRVSTDAGEDSADDLDESHTDDISRITDLENETPSFSEDTFSKDDVFYNASSASLGCAPVIPTSSQYGLALVGQNESNPHVPGVPTLNNTDVGEMHVSVTNSSGGSIINIIGNPKPAEGMKEIQEHVRNERFKVVKIESTEPFRRGRWMCMDYLDHTTTQMSAPIIVNNNVDCQTEPSTILNAPDSGVVMNDGQHDEGGTLVESLNKVVGKDLQIPNPHQQDQPVSHSFPIASPGQSLTQPINMMQQNLPSNQSVSIQSPPVEMAQLNQNPVLQSSPSVGQPHAQSMSHISLNPPANHPPPTQQPPVQQMPQSFPSHQLQQVISQGMPQMQQMQMHQQLPPQQMQQMQNQQAQIQQMQGQHLAHNQSQISNLQQMQQMPQMQQLQNQSQIQQMPGQQAQMQQIQMQQMTNQQVSNQQPLHQLHGQQPQIQSMPQQGIHMQNQQTLSNQQPQLQHMQNQTQMHPMQPQQSHQIQSHMQQMQQMPQHNSQGQGMPQMHPQAQMHQMTSQPGQVPSQGGQVQQAHSIHPQLQQQNMAGVQHTYNTQSVGQSTNPQNMMPNQAQHMGQQAQVSQPLVQPQHTVPQYYQQTQLNQQGQSLTQEVMANIVNSQQGSTLPNNLQSMSSQPQGSTLPSNLQGMNAQQNPAMHSLNQSTQSIPQNTMQMMSQASQNIPMSMDSNQSNMQIPVADPMYLQTSNVNQQIPMGQHITPQQNLMNQQVSSTAGQVQTSHIPQQGQMSMSHVMSPQQGLNNQSSVPNQSVVVNQTNMQNVPVQQNQQMPQVSLANVAQQPTQPMMQNMGTPNQQSMNQNVVQHNQNIGISMQQNMPPMQPTSVHSVPTSVVQSQTSMHSQVGMPIGGFNPQGGVGSMSQNVMPAMSQTNMTSTMGIPNSVNNQMDIHISQQNICSSTTAASQPAMSGTNSPVVSLPVSSAMNYTQNQTPPSNAVDGQNFGSPVSGVVSHVVNSLITSMVGLSAGDNITSESGGGTPASDGTQQIDIYDGKDDSQAVQNNEDSESASGTSAVAIDNKIEQAMDLVKSHLMFAVREEVEVLKEKIAELMERINQLEVENSILRAHASQETLAQLTAPPAAPALLPPAPPTGPVS